MKTTTIILAAVLTFSVNFLFAGNDESRMNTETTIDIATLAPVTPIEADFASDDDTTNARVFAPVTPSVADFSDGI